MVGRINNAYGNSLSCLRLIESDKLDDRLKLQ